MFDTMPEYIWWSAGLVVGFPLASVFLSEVCLRLQRRESPLTASVNYVRYLILPTFALAVFLVKVAELAPGGIANRVVQTLLWLFVTHAALSFVNGVLFANVKEGTWQARMPKLFIDMIRGVLVVVSLAIVLATVWDLDLSRVLTALGVGSIVLGLALQEPLSNLFSGILLLFERPLRIGDWVRIGDAVGKVVETNWRAVHIQPIDTGEVVVPNAVLSRGSFLNFSRPTQVHHKSITMKFSLADPPNKVKRILKETVLGTRGVLADTQFIALLSYGDSWVSYLVYFGVADYAAALSVADDFQTRAWYAARRHGLTIYTTHAEIVLHTGVGESARAPLPVEALLPKPAARFRFVDQVLSEEFRSQGEVKHYAGGEQVVGEGEHLPGMFFILQGQAALTARDAQNQAAIVARLGRGEFFGEKVFLAGDVSDVTVTAEDDLEVLLLDRDALGRLLDPTPAFARHIVGVLEARRKVLQTLRTSQRAKTG